jgi:hypothetical protein
MELMRRAKILMMPLSRLKRLDGGYKNFSVDPSVAVIHGKSKPSKAYLALGGQRKKKLKASDFHPYNSADWQDTLPINNARAILGKGVLLRKSDQSFNFFGVLGSVGLIVVVLYVWIWLLSGASRKGKTQSEYLATKLIQYAGTVEATITLPADILALTGTPTITRTAEPTSTATMIPTATMMSTATIPFRAVSWQYSYYNPALGGVNCAVWDENSQKCISSMSSGLDWHNFYDKAVACPLSYPLWTKIEVVTPEELRGVWVCMDYCAVCKENDIIDFLQLRQYLPWRTPIQSKVYFP